MKTEQEIRDKIAELELRLWKIERKINTEFRENEFNDEIIRQKYKSRIAQLKWVLK